MSSVGDLDNEVICDGGSKEEGPLQDGTESSHKVVMISKKIDNSGEGPHAKDHEIIQERLVDQMVQDPQPINVQGVSGSHLEFRPKDYEIIKESLVDQMVQDPEPINVQEIEAIRGPEPDNQDYYMPDFFSFHSEDNDDENSDNISNDLDEFLNQLPDDPRNESSNNVSKEIENDEPRLPKSVHDPEISFQYLEVFPECRDPVADNEYETTIDVYGDQLPSHLKNYLKSNNSGKRRLTTIGIYGNYEDNVDYSNTKSNKNHENKHDGFTVGSRTIIKGLNYSDDNGDDVDNDKNIDNIDNDNISSEKYNFMQIQSSTKFNSEIEGFSCNGDGALPSPLRTRLEETTNTSGIDFFEYLPHTTTRISHDIMKDKSTNNKEMLHDYHNTASRENSAIHLSNSISEQMCYKNNEETSAYNLCNSQIQQHPVGHNSLPEFPSFHSQPYQQSTTNENHDYNYGGYHHPIHINPTTTSNNLSIQPSASNDLSIQPLKNNHLSIQPSTSNDLSNQPLTSNDLSHQILKNNDLSNQPSTSNNLFNQPEEFMIPSVSYPPISCLGFPQSLPVIYPCDVGHMAPPPIVFPPIPFKFPYAEPMQSTLPTWRPYTRFPEPGPCYRTEKNYGPAMCQNSNNSKIRIDNSKANVPNHTCTRYYYKKYGKYLPCKLENCNEICLRNVRKDITYEISNEDVNVKMLNQNLGNDGVDIKNDNNNNNCNDFNDENLKSAEFNKLCNFIPNLSSLSEKKVPEQDKSFDIPTTSQVPMLLNPSDISEKQKISSGVPIPDISIDSLEVFPIDATGKKCEQEMGRSNITHGNILTPLVKVTSLSGDQSVYNIDPLNNLFYINNIEQGDTNANDFESFNDNSVINDSHKKNYQNNNNDYYYNSDNDDNYVDNNNNTLGRYKQNKNIVKNPEIQLQGARLIHKLSTEEKDKYCIDLTGNNYLDYNNSNDNYNGLYINKKEAREYIDLTLDDNNEQKRVGQVVVDITENDKGTQNLSANIPHFKTNVPNFSKRLGDKTEQTQQITAQRIGFDHPQLVHKRTSEDLQDTVRKRGRPKGSKNRKIFKRARETEEFSILAASRVHRIQKPIPILPKEDFSTKNVLYTGQSHKRETLSQFSKFSAYSKPPSVFESLSDVIDQYSLIAECEDEQKSKVTSNVPVVKYLNKSEESFVNSSKNNKVCPNSTEYSENFDNQSNSEPLGCIAPMEAGNSEKMVASPNYINQEDISFCHIGLPQRSATDVDGNISDEISKECKKSQTNLSKKDVNGNYLMILNSSVSVDTGKDVRGPFELESNTDSLDNSRDEYLKQPHFESAQEVSNNNILRLLDSESVPQVDQKKFCLATIDLMKQFRIIQVNKNVAKPENKRTYVDKNKEEDNENPYKRVYKERVRETPSRGRARLSCVKNKGYQDAYMKFLYED